MTHGSWEDGEPDLSVSYETRWGEVEVYRENDDLVFDYPDRVDDTRVSIPSELSLYLTGDTIRYERCEEGIIGSNGSIGRTEEQKEEVRETDKALREIKEALDVGSEFMR